MAILSNMRPANLQNGIFRKDETIMISYTSTNGYKGIIYGESSLKVFDHTGKEVFHARNTSYRNIQELKEFVDDFPNQREGLLKLYEELSK